MPDIEDDVQESNPPVVDNKTWALAVSAVFAVMLALTGIFWKWSHAREPPKAVEEVPVEVEVEVEPIPVVYKADMLGMKVKLRHDEPIHVNYGEEFSHYEVVIQFQPPECQAAFEKPD